VTVKGLTEGKPYEFRVAAVNEAGPGDYAETKEAIKPAPAPSQLLILPRLSHELWMTDVWERATSIPSELLVVEERMSSSGCL